jgi:hypothetical protein
MGDLGSKISVPSPQGDVRSRCQCLVPAGNSDESRGGGLERMERPDGLKSSCLSEKSLPAARLFDSAAGIRFFDLVVGGAFRIGTGAGWFGGEAVVYFKTGPESYGLQPGEALWPWLDFGDRRVELVENVIALPAVIDVKEAA